jgi:hypothetical protein
MIKMSTQSETLRALLSYYTQMSLSHASIVVASIFGLFSILRIISDPRRTSKSKYILGLVYLVLLGLGVYSTIRYKFYSDRAKSIAINSFGAEEWPQDPLWHLLGLVLIPLFDYGWAAYFTIGILAFVGVCDDFRHWIRNRIAKLIPRDCKKLTKLVLLSATALILMIATFSAGYIIGSNYAFSIGRTEVTAKIRYHENVALNLSSNDVIAKLKQMFTKKLNYTQLLTWESARLNYTEGAIERHTDPIAILDYGLGRCGEFSILYASICLANGIPARLVTDAVVDHVWTEVNPSIDGKTWIHVDPTQSCVRILSGESIYREPATVNNTSFYVEEWHSDFQMVIAFQVTAQRQVLVVDRTSVYVS